MDRHRHAGMEAHFSGTSTTILVDTQHALILNYADTKPCNARENLPYRQEQHPRLSSRRTFVEDYPHYRDLSTLLPLDHPRKRDQEAVSTVLPSFPPSLSRPFVSLFRLLSYPKSPYPLDSVFFLFFTFVGPVDGKKRICVTFFCKIDRFYVSSLFVYVKRCFRLKKRFVGSVWMTVWFL